MVIFHHVFDCENASKAERKSSRRSRPASSSSEKGRGSEGGDQGSEVEDTKGRRSSADKVSEDSLASDATGTGADPHNGDSKSGTGTETDEEKVVESPPPRGSRKKHRSRRQAEDY